MSSSSPYLSWTPHHHHAGRVAPADVDPPAASDTTGSDHHHGRRILFLVPFISSKLNSLGTGGCGGSSSGSRIGPQPLSGQRQKERRQNQLLSEGELLPVNTKCLLGEERHFRRLQQQRKDPDEKDDNNRGGDLFLRHPSLSPICLEEDNHLREGDGAGAGRLAAWRQQRSEESAAVIEYGWIPAQVRSLGVGRIAALREQDEDDVDETVTAAVTAMEQQQQQQQQQQNRDAFSVAVVDFEATAAVEADDWCGRVVLVEDHGKDDDDASALTVDTVLAHHLQPPSPPTKNRRYHHPPSKWLRVVLFGCRRVGRD